MMINSLLILVCISVLMMEKSFIQMKLITWTVKCAILKYKLMDNSGEGNGTPLQYSCLENPTDGRA